MLWDAGHHLTQGPEQDPGSGQAAAADRGQGLETDLARNVSRRPAPSTCGPAEGVYWGVN